MMLLPPELWLAIGWTCDIDSQRSLAAALRWPRDTFVRKKRPPSNVSIRHPQPNPIMTRNIQVISLPVGEGRAIEIELWNPANMRMFEVFQRGDDGLEEIFGIFFLDKDGRWERRAADGRGFVYFQRNQTPQQLDWSLNIPDFLMLL